MAKVLVFGSTSYLGTSLIRRLVQEGWQVYVYARRDSHLFLLREMLDKVHAVDSVSALGIGNIDAIVNFGFVKGDSSRSVVLKETKKMVEHICETTTLLGPRILLQISSMAVFGNAGSFKPQVVKDQTKDDYADGKILAENLILSTTFGPQILPVIVRLGNVMGEDAANWTGSIIDRILDLKPFTTNQNWGYSNVTYVHNIVDYLVNIMNSNSQLLQRMGHFHHLAEFSGVTWDRWLYPLCRALGVPSEYLSVPERAKGESVPGKLRLLKLVRSALNRPALKGVSETIGDKLLRIPVLGSRAANFKSRIPYNLTLINGPSDVDLAFRQIISAPVEFKSHVISTWSPPNEFAGAMENILRAANGY